MANSEDFSFPTHSAPSSSTGSPPLWNRHFLPSLHRETERRNPQDEEEEEEHKPVKDYILKRSLSCMELEEEEKMDMLWEDFNEELSKLCGPGCESEMSLPRKATELGGVHSLPLLKTGTGFPGKKMSIEVLVRFLKKIFLVRKAKREMTRKL